MNATCLALLIIVKPLLADAIEDGAFSGDRLTQADAVLKKITATIALPVQDECAVTENERLREALRQAHRAMCGYQELDGEAAAALRVLKEHACAVEKNCRRNGWTLQDAEEAKLSNLP